MSKWKLCSHLPPQRTRLLTCVLWAGAVLLAEQQPQLRGDHQVVPGLEVHVLGPRTGAPAVKDKFNKAPDITDRAVSSSVGERGPLEEALSTRTTVS